MKISLKIFLLFLPFVFSCETVKKNIDIVKNETKVDSTHTKVVKEDVDTFTVDSADTFAIDIPTILFTDTNDTGTYVFDSEDQTIIIKKGKKKTKIIAIDKEEVNHFKYHRETYEQTHLKKATKDYSKSKSVTRIQMPWWLWLILILLFLIGLYVLYRRLKKKYGWTLPF